MSHEHDGIEKAALLYGLAGTVGAEPVTPDARLRARTMRSLGRAGAYGKFADRIARLFDVPMDRAQELLRRIEDPSVFVPFLVSGVAMFPVQLGSSSLRGAVAAFGLLTPGATFPRHDHVGDEVTVVLDGAFRDESGREVWRGEELVKSAGSNHDFVVIGDRPCVAAVLAMGGVSFR
jgi:putative transcriptional regulator